jgi:hypothetical protein
MTYYDFSVISPHGFPYFDIEIKPIPQGKTVFLRFFDFSENEQKPEQPETKFELKAGLISALYNFSNSIDKKIRVLEFKTNKESHQAKKESGGNVLITVTTESYLFHDQVKKKIDLIFNTLIHQKLPLDSANEITYNEETEIIEILTDVSAKSHISKHKDKIQRKAHTFLEEMGPYGLKAIVMTSMDLSPIDCFADEEEYCIDDINNILRNIGNIPKIDPFEWKYRQSFFQQKQIWVFLINSGVGISVDNLFQPYYYLLITEPNSYLGEFPAKLTSEFNSIIS